MVAVYTQWRVPVSITQINLDISETRKTDWLTVATEETDHSHVDELVTGHG